MILTFKQGTEKSFRTRQVDHHDLHPETESRKFSQRAAEAGERKRRQRTGGLNGQLVRGEEGLEKTEGFPDGVSSFSLSCSSFPHFPSFFLPINHPDFSLTNSFPAGRKKTVTTLLLDNISLFFASLALLPSRRHSGLSHTWTHFRCTVCALHVTEGANYWTLLQEDRAAGF